LEKILSDQCDRSGHTVAFFLVIVPLILPPRRVACGNYCQQCSGIRILFLLLWNYIGM